jgi:tetratricopeptide (TPR) repeat protein
MTASPSPSPLAPLSRDRLFARLICTGAENQVGGIVTATRGRLRRLFCIKKGWLVFATSNLVEEQFVEYLARTDAIPPEAYARAVEEATNTGAKPLAVLVKSGGFPNGALQAAMEGLIRELFTSTLEWPDGDFQFEEGLPRLDGEVAGRLSTRALILAHAKRYPASIDAVRIRIGPPDLRPVATDAAKAPGDSTDALGAYLTARCDGTVDLAQLVKDSPADENATLRAIYGQLLAGLLDPEDRQARREREARLKEDALTREECLGRLAMAAGQDHYGVLGVERTARPKAIRLAYYNLAKRYHPDRFRSGPLADLLPRFEEFFMMVTDAHNTLSDYDRRQEYNEMLAGAGAAEAKEADSGYLAKQNYLRGRALAAQRKYTEAVTFLENAISLDPGHAEYHMELGLILALNPRHREDAERHLRQAIQLSPTAVPAYVALGQIYLKSNRPGRAGRMAREALRWEPGHLEASEILKAAGDAIEEREEQRNDPSRSS